MRYLPGIFIVAIIFSACDSKPGNEESKKTPTPVVGTWKLFQATIIEKGDTTITNYTDKLSFIKIINDSHFAFLQHDLSKGKDSANAAFSAGGGTYSLVDKVYTEHLEYCSAREWEGHDFKFDLTISNDTLIQSGVEKIESAGIDRINIEKYVRFK